jgi:hypothetical protein
MLHGILGDDSHRFVHGIAVVMSLKVTDLFFCLSHFICIIVVRNSLGHMESVLLSYPNSAFIFVTL